MSKLCKDCACEWVCGITHTPENEACEFYKAEAITELEKIKAEINEYLIASFADDEDFRWFNLCLDTHIKELNNENTDRPR